MRRIAAGGMAEVWRAEALFEEGDSYPVAIKRVLPSLSQQSMLRSMFADEARLGMQLRHPNIARVYDARDVSGTFIMVMELVDGAPLKDLLDRSQARRAGMPVPAALHIAREVAAALDYVHSARGADGSHLEIVHRDVSPHNVLLGKDGAVKLTDFGLADANVHETVRSQELVGGKLGYLAPEIVRQQPTDHRVDLFSLGIVLWEMLAGRRLFQGDSDEETVRAVARCEVPSLQAINERVPADVDDLVARLLARDPDERMLTARALHAELEQLIPQIDARVSSKDVALLVGLSRAGRERPAEPPDLADLLRQELDAFAEAAAGTEYDLGASPLDPDEFATRHP